MGVTLDSTTRPAILTRDQIETIRARHPIEDVVSIYTDLRRSGRVLKGHCPLPGHEDRTPSFCVYVADQRFYCFGCNRGGDVFEFLELVEQLNFREAVERLEGSTLPQLPRGRPAPPASSGMATHMRHTDWEDSTPVEVTPAQARVLTAVATLYHTTLLTNREVLEYVRGRGISMEMIRRFRLGYATGSDLAEYFKFRGWSLEPARELGLLNEHGEFFDKRIVIPEIRAGHVVYLVGRSTLDSQQQKYLGLPRVAKPLYGLESARGSSEVFIVEGPFDWLTLTDWGYPAVALLGSHMKSEWVEELSFARRLYIVTDSDDAGRQSAEQLASQLGRRAVVVPPLPDAKDVNELAGHTGAAAIFMELVQLAAQGT